jgi:hypothetical protein
MEKYVKSSRAGNLIAMDGKEYPMKKKIEGKTYSLFAKNVSKGKQVLFNKDEVEALEDGKLSMWNVKTEKQGDLFLIYINL